MGVKFCTISTGGGGLKVEFSIDSRRFVKTFPPSVMFISHIDLWELL